MKRVSYFFVFIVTYFMYFRSRSQTFNWSFILGMPKKHHWYCSHKFQIFCTFRFRLNFASESESSIFDLTFHIVSQFHIYKKLSEILHLFEWKYKIRIDRYQNHWDKLILFMICVWPFFLLHFLLLSKATISMLKRIKNIDPMCNEQDLKKADPSHLMLTRNDLNSYIAIKYNLNNLNAIQIP